MQRNPIVKRRRILFGRSFTGAALLVSGLAGATVAPGPEMPLAVSAPAGGPARLAQGLDPRDHVQSQLDWRSYYLNRLDGPRHRVSRGVQASAAAEGSDEK